MSFLFPAFVNLNYYYLYYELLKSSVWNFSFIRLIIVHSFFTLHVLKNFINVFIFLICVILLLKALRYWRAGFRFLIEVLAKCMLNPLLYWVFFKGSYCYHRFYNEDPLSQAMCFQVFECSVYTISACLSGCGSQFVGIVLICWGAHWNYLHYSRYFRYLFQQTTGFEQAAATMNRQYFVSFEV